jgi:hypothetical protein
MFEGSYTLAHRSVRMTDGRGKTDVRILAMVNGRTTLWTERSYKKWRSDGQINPFLVLLRLDNEPTATFIVERPSIKQLEQGTH